MSNGRPEISFLIALFLVQLHWGFRDFQKSNAGKYASAGLENPKLRKEWRNSMLADPTTGKIPNNIKEREAQFLADLQPNESRSSNYNWRWTSLGPKNIGGRTRALQIDVTNPGNLLAGGASGGIFRSDDGGNSWQKVSASTQNLAITGLAQDTKSGFQNVWFACTGEARGGNQISGNSAYSGNGVFKSTDSGKTWFTLPFFSNPSPQTTDSTDRAWRIMVSHNTNQVLLASTEGIHLSEDGGSTWKLVYGQKGNSNAYTDIIQCKNGTFYAVVNGGNGPEFIRSTNAKNWNKISSPSLANGTRRIVLAANPSPLNERIYLLAETPNSGQFGYDFRGSSERHSLLKFSHTQNNSGNWEDLSTNIPIGPYQFDDFISQSGYCMDVAVSPYDSNLIVLGGTNLYISHDGFTSDSNTYFAGGYGEKTAIPDFELYPNHHPDLQTIVFHPTDKNILFTGSDGGIHKTFDLYDTSVVWQSLNNGYLTTQFYTLRVALVDPYMRIMGGLQDNGTLLSVDANRNLDWTLPMSYDGGHCFFTDSSDIIYASKQMDGIAKIKLNSKGERIAWTRIDPPVNGSYLFINPYLLNPTDKNTMYLPVSGELWVNHKLDEFQWDGNFNKQSKNWKRIVLPGTFQTSALATTKSMPQSLFLGSSTGNLLKLTNIQGGNASILDLSNNLDGRGYINSISINPNDSNEILVIYSNYNTYSVYHSTDGGFNFQNISGNLEGEPIPGVPPGFEFLNNGPSCRTGAIVSNTFTYNNLYFVGTSVGLFVTETLDSMNTKWTQVSPSELQNFVISDIEYFEPGKDMYVSTYGNGVYKASLEDLVFTKEELPEHENWIDLYPNPANDYLKLQLQSKRTFDKFLIYSNTGKLVWSGLPRNKESTISVSKLKSGIYYLVGYSQNQPYSASFVVSR